MFPTRLLVQRAVVATPSLTGARRSSSGSGKISIQQQDSGQNQQQLRMPPSQMSNMMDIGSRRIFNEDHDMFRESVRGWMRGVLAPQQAAFEEAGMPTRQVWEDMGAQGLLGLGLAEEEGGMGGTFRHEAIALEEACYAQCTAPNAAVHSAICIPYVAKYGSEELKRRMLPGMVAGKRVCSVAMSEPDAGSDLQGIRTTAKKDGDNYYILNGSKTFISNGIVGDTHIIVAVTNSEAKTKAHGISLIVIEDGMEGFKKGKNLKKLGLKTQDTAELFFEDVRVPAGNVLGGPDSGFYLLMSELPQERLAIAVVAAAMCEWMFEETRAYVSQRKAFGKTISSLQTVQHKMAELKANIAACRAFVDECIELHEQGALPATTAAMAKFWTTDLENRVAAECLQLHGGSGYMWDTPIAKAYANSRVQTIYGGSNEIMKELVARGIF